MKSFLFSIFFIFFTFNVNAQVGIGTTNPDASSMLDISSTSSGLLIPRVALTATNVAGPITAPVTSLLVYNTATAGVSPNNVVPGYYYWNGAWIALAGSGGNNWTLTGNSGTTAGTHYLGTADGEDLRIKTGGNDRLNISDSNGQIQSYTNTGSAATPSYSFSDTQNSTGMFNPAADNLGFATAGTEKVRIELDGDVSIGLTPPDASAKLDIQAGVAGNRGLLIPNVVLSATNVAAPITSPATSLLVYNTATDGVAPNNVVPGYYYWNGVWVPLATGTLTNDWSILGNTNIVDGTNFLGTGAATNVDVAFRRNNAAAGKIGATSTSFGVGALNSGAASNSTAFGTNALTVNTGNNNTAIGSSATIIAPLVAVLASALAANTTGANNTAVGAGSLAANVTGANNTAVGVGSLAANTATGNTAVGSSALTTNSTGTGNSALGTNALRLNSTGTNNTAIGTSSSTLTPLAAALGANTTASNITAVGASALAANTTGSGNSALGSNALRLNTTGINNTAIGTSASTVTPLVAALAANTTGGNNTAVGAGALAANNTGTGNTGIGSQALAANNTVFGGQGINNTAIGSSALLGNTTGASNVALGASAGATITTGSNNIMIGANTVAPVVTGSSQLNIGNTIFGNMAGALASGVNTTRTIGINVLSPLAALDITSSDNGLLIPRVALTDTATVTVLTGTASEIVYNTATNLDVTPGFYFLSTNTGPWVRFNTGTASGWLTNGNTVGAAGTFMGTLDNYDVSFRRFNTAAGFIGANSTAFGVSSLATNSGTNNTAFGTNALAANNSPGDNTAIGYNALAANTLNSGAGNLNTAVGSGALDSLNGGARNTAVGANALTGVNDNASLDNVAVGQNALPGVGTITQSVAVGSGALLNSGSATTRSTAVGFNAGNNVSLSIDSVFIGTNALGTGPTATNQIAIGSGATASGDNAVRLGNTAITTINGQVNFTATSDRRWKDNIQDSNLGLEFIKTVRPVSYFRKNDKNKKTEYGFIAQELETAFVNAGDSNNAVVSKDTEGMYGVRYSDFISISVKAIQEQQEEIEALKQQNAELMKTNAAILKRLEALEKK